MRLLWQLQNDPVTDAGLRQLPYAECLWQRAAVLPAQVYCSFMQMRTPLKGPCKSSVHRRKPVLRQHPGRFHAVSFGHPEPVSRNQIARQVQLLNCVQALQEPLVSQPARQLSVCHAIKHQEDLPG